MKFTEIPLRGAFLIAPEPCRDERGAFTRTWCRDEFEKRGLCADIAQCSLSSNDVAGTLRGLHFQAAPHEEVKLVRCICGSVYDVIVDLRPGSPTWGTWTAANLSARNGLMLYVPSGFAHGFQTLEDNSEVSYQISVPYAPAFSRGVRWDDPELGIDWPLPDPIISNRDRNLPLLGDLHRLQAA